MPINKTSLALVLVFAAQIPEICSASSVSYACQTPASKALPFCDSRLSFEDRVKDLTGRLTPGEKVSLMLDTKLNRSPSSLERAYLRGMVSSAERYNENDSHHHEHGVTAPHHWD